MSDQKHAQLQESTKNKKNHSLILESLLNELTETDYSLSELLNSPSIRTSLVKRKEVNNKLNHLDTILFILSHGGSYRQKIGQRTISYSRTISITTIKERRISEKIKNLQHNMTKLRRVSTSFSFHDSAGLPNQLKAQKDEILEQSYFQSEQIIKSFIQASNHNILQQEKWLQYILYCKYLLILITIILAIIRPKEKQEEEQPPSKLNIDDEELLKIINKIPTGIIIHNQKKNTQLVNDSFHQQFNIKPGMVTETLCSTKSCIPEKCPFHTQDNTAHCTIQHEGKTIKKFMQKALINQEPFLIETYLSNSKATLSASNVSSKSQTAIFNFIQSIPVINNEVASTLLSQLQSTANCHNISLFKVIEKEHRYYGTTIANFSGLGNDTTQSIFKILPHKRLIPQDIVEKLSRMLSFELNQSNFDILKALDLKTAILFPIKEGDKIWGGVLLEYQTEKKLSNSKQITIAQATSLISQMLTLKKRPSHDTSLYQLQATISFLSKENHFLKQNNNFINETIKNNIDVFHMLTEELSTTIAKNKLISPNIPADPKTLQLINELQFLTKRDVFTEDTFSYLDDINKIKEELKKESPNTMLEIQYSPTNISKLPIEKETLHHIFRSMVLSLSDCHSSFIIIIRIIVRESTFSIGFDEKHSENNSTIFGDEFFSLNTRAELNKSSGITLMTIGHLLNLYKGNINIIEKGKVNYYYELTFPSSTKNDKDSNQKCIFLLCLSKEAIKKRYSAIKLNWDSIELFESWKDLSTAVSEHPPHLIVIEQTATKASVTKTALLTNNNPHIFTASLGKNKDNTISCDFYFSYEEFAINITSILSFSEKTDKEKTKSQVLVIDKNLSNHTQFKNIDKEVANVFFALSPIDAEFKLKMIKPSFIFLDTSTIDSKTFEELLETHAQVTMVKCYNSKKSALNQYFGNIQAIDFPIDQDWLDKYIKNSSV